MPMYKRKGTKRKTVNKNQLGNFVKKVVTSLEEKKAQNGVISQEQLAGPINNPFVSASTGWVFKSCFADFTLFAPTYPGIVQGTAKNQRIGERIRLTKIEFAIHILPASTIGTTMQNGTACRFIIYHNKQANGVLPTPAEVWNDNNIYTTRNSTFMNRLSILKDFTHQMVATGTDNTGAVTASGPQLVTTMTIYPKQSITFTGSASAIANILKNDYGFAVCGDGVNCCQVYVRTQIMYTDD